MLSKLQLQNVCLLHSGNSDTCVYLAHDDMDYSKYCCMKMRKLEKDKIDKKAEDFVRQCKKKGMDPYDQGVPLGDNCKGYPLLKFITQGYDIKP